MGLPTSVHVVKDPSQVCLEARLLGDSEFCVELTAGAEDLCVSLLALRLQACTPRLSFDVGAGHLNSGLSA